jgi:D-sedoheptulose 7-phosphate isomerase
LSIYPIGCAGAWFMLGKSMSDLNRFLAESLEERNRLSQQFFALEASRLSEACRQMSQRFAQGGRLLAFGQGPYISDAQHVSVEFVHPVIVGKRALPALDVSLAFREWLEVLTQPTDMVMGFAPKAGDPEVETALELAKNKGALTFALAGTQADFAFAPPIAHPLIHQEILEILYHTLWETVHVFDEHRSSTHDAGAASFLYPFLSPQSANPQVILQQVASSIISKVAEDITLRQSLEIETIARAIEAIAYRLKRGGKIIALGNGGSATDANDFALDCVAPPLGWKPIPAISLALEPANLSAIANDVGVEVMFLRQLIAQAQPHDVVLAISTSGGSKNIVLALEEARKRRLLTVALLGNDGGEVRRRGLADATLVVNSHHIPRIQEVQASVYHLIREGLEMIRLGLSLKPREQYTEGS